MAILGKLKALLDEAKVSYEVFTHPLAYTADEIAARQHMSGKEMAKVVMLTVDGNLLMAVVPGSMKVDLNTVRASLRASHVSLAAEDEFSGRFAGCEIGAEPPFGHLFGLRCVVDALLAKDEHIYFNAGNHVQTVRMTYRDFLNLARPEIAALVGADEVRNA